MAALPGLTSTSLTKEWTKARVSVISLVLRNSLISAAKVATPKWWRRSSPRRGTSRPAAEDLLVDDGWKLVEVEPEAALVNGNGASANGNGHHDANSIRPSVELVLGNGHHDEAPEPQQSLFPWAKFMAARTGSSPSRRSRKAQPATLLMFE